MSDARRTLLEGLVDYAGLFPPAALDVHGAVSGYEAARTHPHGWIVDRFVAPAAKVESVGEHAGWPASPWPVALVTDVLALRSAAEAAGRVAHGVRIDVVELRPLPAREVAGAVKAARAVFGGATVYAEVAPGDEPAIAAIAEAGGRVKLRCGGEHVPSAVEVADTLRACAAHGVALKGTAGLHHPVAGPGHHGFLNLLAAAALDGEAEAVADTDASSFVLGEDGFAWRGQPIDPAAARAAFTGFGSCSFDEPVDDLVALGALEAAGSPA